MRVCRNLSVVVLLFRYKCSSEDTNTAPEDKRSSGRSVSKAALCFGNLCMYEPSALRKKLYDSQKKPSNCGRSLPLCCRESLQSHFGKAFRIAASILKTYRTTNTGWLPFLSWQYTYWCHWLPANFVLQCSTNNGTKYPSEGEERRQLKNYDIP